MKLHTKCFALFLFFTIQASENESPNKQIIPRTAMPKKRRADHDLHHDNNSSGANKKRSKLLPEKRREILEQFKLSPKEIKQKTFDQMFKDNDGNGYDSVASNPYPIKRTPENPDDEVGFISEEDRKKRFDLTSNPVCCTKNALGKKLYFHQGTNYVDLQNGFDTEIQKMASRISITNASLQKCGDSLETLNDLDRIFTRILKKITKQYQSYLTFIK